MPVLPILSDLTVALDALALSFFKPWLRHELHITSSHMIGLCEVIPRLTETIFLPLGPRAGLAVIVVSFISHPLAFTFHRHFERTPNWIRRYGLVEKRI